MKSINKFFIRNTSIVILTTAFLTSCKITYTSSKPQTKVQNEVVSNTNPLSAETSVLIDSILQKGLDREALYTLISDIKPISSLSMYTFPIANTDSLAYISGKAFDEVENQKYLDQIKNIQDGFNQLNIPDLKFFVLPYKSNNKKEKNIQLYVARESAVNRVLRKHKHFFGQFGWVEGVNPEILITANEYGFKYDRLRGFGYLFGYPSHAVDFYTEAEYSNEKKNEFVKRKFFQIPTYERESGYFVYAYPDNYVPKKEVDSVLYHKSVEVLDHYKSIRHKFKNDDGSINALKLIVSENFKK